MFVEHSVCIRLMNGILKSVPKFKKQLEMKMIMVSVTSSVVLCVLSFSITVYVCAKKAALLRV